MDLSEVVAALDRLSATGFDDRAYRHVSVGRDPLSREGARLVGGRWNPPASFAVLYLGGDVPTVVREFERLARKQGRAVDEFLPRDMLTYELRLQRLLDLRVGEHAHAVGLTPSDLADEDLSKCQLVGEAANTDVASVRWVGPPA